MFAEIDIIKSAAEYEIVVERTIELFHSEKGTPEFDELVLLLAAIKDYEDIHYPIPVSC